MQIYFEYALLENLLIDYFLIKSSLYITGNQIKKFKIFLSATLGALVAILLPLISVSAVVSFFIKILLAVVMIFLSCEYKTFRGYILALNLFVLLTFLMGGAIIAVMYALNQKVILTDGQVTNQGFPVSIMIGFAFIMTSVTLKVSKSIYRKKQLFPFLRRCEIVAGEKSFSLLGFVDSGNRLYDSKRGCPIVVISRKNLEKNNILPYLSTKLGSIKYNTVSGGGEMPLYKIGGIIFKTNGEIIYKSATLGVSPSEYSGEYDIILHPSFLCG